ncbi:MULTISPECIES: carbohydrate ABC transporter permease [Caproicibacterium]|uniref:Carbohydrate ABC transporter permease n=1 Tax=Caproicibacterium argilliputei TaxID=3030016 RepID=A0AA97H234_9FIRM|nr:carbohydrate ABC transporter permease [Caproicibacterium argilliputei]WOC33103.1 carbohydrate ABC transporter permease [Caproicibacterium argilliputei]
MVQKRKQRSIGRRVFLGINAVIMLFVVTVTLFPFLYMFATSFSSTEAIVKGEVTFWPVDFTVNSYAAILQQQQFWSGYKNTILYTVFGTVIGVLLTAICAYPLSKKKLPGKKGILMFMVFTMYFGGGLVPYYLLITGLHMINTMWAIILPGAISTYNMLVMRTFFMGIPDSLEEAAQIDGLGYLGIFTKIILPLSKPVIATIALFNAVGYWNDWFNPMIYLNNTSKYPVTLFLRNVVMGATLSVKSGQQITSSSSMQTMPQTLQAATIMLVTIPILCVYPFVQKYFVKGVMIGSIKE